MPPRKRTPATKRAAPRKATTTRKTAAKRTAPKKAAQKKARRATAAQGAAYALKGVDPVPGPGERVWVLEVPHFQQAQAEHYGVRYVDTATYRGWVYTGRHLPEALHGWASTPFTWARYAEDTYNGVVFNPAPTTDNGRFVLRADQVADRDKILEAWRAGAPDFLVGNGTGVGKTVTTIAAVKCMPGIRTCLVVTMKGAIPVWVQHLREMGTGGIRWVVINYEGWGRLLTIPAESRKAALQRTKNKHHAREGVPRATFDVVIRDESHNVANAVAQQTTATGRLARSTPDTYSVCLSATPARDPSKLAYLGRGMAWRTGTAVPPAPTPEWYAEFMQRHGIQVHANDMGGLEWRSNDTAELDIMHALLFGGEPTWACKTDPPDWPQRLRRPVPVTLTPPEAAEYERVWEDFKRTMHILGRRFRAARTAREQNAIQAEGRAAQIRYRQKLGILMVPHATEYTKVLLAQGQQVAISCEFLDTITNLRAELGRAGIACSTITGTQLPGTGTREEERVAFQRGERKVCIFNIAEAISLHANDAGCGGNSTPRTTLVVEKRWSPLKTVQIEGRTHRNGEAAPAEYLYIPDTISGRVLKRALEGIAATNTMMGGDVESAYNMADELGMVLFEEE